eukprot:2626797-Rhodomonas_salina.1
MCIRDRSCLVASNGCRLPCVTGQAHLWPARQPPRPAQAAARGRLRLFPIIVFAVTDLRHSRFVSAFAAAGVSIMCDAQTCIFRSLLRYLSQSVTVGAFRVLLSCAMPGSDG